MQKTITISGLIFLTWIILDTFHVINSIMSFMLVGAIPGSNASVSPTMMLAIVTTLGGIVVFELLARRFNVIRRIRYHFLVLTRKQDRLPKHRFGRA
ncbi:MAG: hypothetical protein JWO07_179 [Candidatus Saccharibacteria bacterium]|nr:hypothetical protein [Candidatus Saccharibacteria bacterium]